MAIKRKSARIASDASTKSKAASPDPSSDSEDGDERFHKIIIDDASESEAAHSDFEPTNKRKRVSEKKRQNKRSRLIPGSPPDVPDASDEDSDDEDLEYDKEDIESAGSPSKVVAMRKKLVPASVMRNAEHSTIAEQSTMLQIHIAPRQDGPSIINLNLADLLQSTPHMPGPGNRAFMPTQASNFGESDLREGDEGFTNLSRARKLLAISRDKKNQIAKAGEKKSRLGFLDLPVELRHQIYGEVFDHSDKTVDFTSTAPINFSAQFLRTCETVYAEGRSYLYDRNRFLIKRDTRTRGQFFENEWKEIGFKDIRRFFSAIGKVNVSHLRYLEFILGDAPPSVTRAVPEPLRKFVNDPILHNILDTIGRGTTLKELTLEFRGRAMVAEGDYHFLRYLTRIKCEKLICLQTVGFYYTNRIRTGLAPKLRKLMEVPKEVEAEKNKATLK